MKVFDNIATYRKLECLVATGLLCLILSVDSFAQTTYYSKVSGDWDLASTWQTGGCGGGGPDAGPPTATDNVVVCNGQTVTLTGDVTIANLTINSGAFIDGAKNMEATGNIDIDGTYGDQAVMGGLTLSGANATMDGTGVIACKDGVTVSDGGSGGNKTILSTANLTVRKVFEIDNGLTVTNYGAISMIDNLNGGNASSTWVNESNSTLNAAKTLLNQGVLFASATGNTVNYNQAGNQNMKTPDANTYYHLQTQGNGIKKMFGGTNIILGNLTISATLDCNGNNINIAGNWINTGAFTTQTATVTFDGSSAQALTNSLGETFYDLTFNKSAGTLTLNDNATVTNILTMTSGNVDATSGTLILGDACGNVGTLSHASGSVIGKFRRWINNTGTPGPPVVYPVGTASNYRPALVSFNAVTCGTLTGEFIATDPGSSGLPLGEVPLSPADSIRNTFVEGYWTLTAANSLSSTNYDLELTGGGFSSFTVNSSTRVLKRISGANPWLLNGTHADVVAAPVGERDALSDISAFDFCFGDSSNCTGPATGAMAGVDSVCVSTSESYSVPYAPPPVSTFTWTVIGGTIASGQGSSGITVNWGATGQVGQVQVVENNGCTDGAPVTKTVNIHSLPTSAITGSNGVGEFATGEPYSVTGRPAYTYTWSITGGTVATGQGTSSITVNWGAAGSGNVRVTASTTCGSAPPVDLPITIYSTIISIDDG
ncbi:MAG: hypothetical protein JKX74_01180, partial [Flavobacteriales bacterium]|nr:hypothetical protein [Flavobacteriales bacterium]